jgi:hypothetical protein
MALQKMIKSAKPEEIPSQATPEQQRIILKRILDQVWNRQNDLESRIEKLEKQGA